MSERAVSMRAQWENDSATKKCRKCNKPFGALRRRHHCRECGKLYCDKCSKGRTMIGGQLERVCDFCVMMKDALGAQGQAQRPVSIASQPLGPGHTGARGRPSQASARPSAGGAPPPRPPPGSGAGAGAATGNGLDAAQIGGLRGLPGNDRCVDCGAADPSWVSLSHAALICMHCSAYHRALGVDISFVRSLEMDDFSEPQMQSLISGGNAKLSRFLGRPVPIVQHRVNESSQREMQDYIHVYATAEAELYRRRTDAMMTGKPVPERLDEPYTPPVSLSHAAAMGAGKAKAKKWTKDKDKSSCEQCNAMFTMMFRRHHCRKCGQVLCENCCPADNKRPMPELGTGSKPVRVCLKCFMPPSRKMAEQARLHAERESTAYRSRRYSSTGMGNKGADLYDFALKDVVIPEAEFC